MFVIKQLYTDSFIAVDGVFPNIQIKKVENQAQAKFFNSKDEADSFIKFLESICSFHYVSVEAKRWNEYDDIKSMVEAFVLENNLTENMSDEFLRVAKAFYQEGMKDASSGEQVE